MASGVGEAIRMENVDITIGSYPIVAGIDLSIGAGEFMCLLGPSGCGKSTILNVIAGFVPPSAGRVSVGGRQVKGPGIDRGVVFQSSEALFPWLTVRQNVEYGPCSRGVPKSERSDAAMHYINLVGLGQAADKYPEELSGGMRQRAQIARILVNEPPVILMDEPFGALDAQTRQVMQSELERIRRATGATILFITHDISEAVLLADRIVTMTAGPAARLKSNAEVDMKYPRELTDAAAVELYHRLRDDIGEEVTKVLKAQGLA